MIDRRVLDALLRRNDMTVVSLAVSLNVIPNTINNWKHHGRAPSRKNILALAKLLNIDPPILAGVPVPYVIEFESEREEYRMGYLSALMGREKPPTLNTLRPWAQGYKDGLAAVEFGFRE